MIGLTLLPVLLFGCKPPLQAPENTEDMMVFGFVHFNEPGAVELLVDPLTAWAPEHLDELTAGYEITALTEDDVLAAGVAGVNADNILGVMGHAEYSVDPPTVAYGITYPHHEEINESTVSYEVLDSSGDLDCFLRTECDAYSYHATEVEKIPLLGQSTRTYRQEMRWIPPPDGGPPILIQRQIGDTPIEFTVKGILEVDQQYGFTMIYPTDDGARRLEAFWIDARVLGNLSLPPGFAVHQAAQAMSSTADAFDVWVAENPPP